MADGADRLREAGGYKEERRRLLIELAQRHELERASGSWWRRLWLEIRMRRALRIELNKKFPPGALHVAG